MKIAVLMVGHLRGFDQCAPAMIKNLFQDHEIDLYITTYQKRYNIKKKYREGRAQNPEIINTQQIYELYGPYLKQVNILTEENFHYTYSKQYAAKSAKGYGESQAMLNRLKTMLRLIYYSYQSFLVYSYPETEDRKYLLAKPKQYDLMIRIRPDLQIATPIDLDGLDFSLTAKRHPLYLFKHSKFPIADYLMIGKPETIGEVCEFSERMEELSRATTENYNRMEWAWVNYFQFCKINWQTLPDYQENCDFEIIRR